jgi:hypothetical protein
LIVRIGSGLTGIGFYPLALAAGGSGGCFHFSILQRSSQCSFLHFHWYRTDTGARNLWREISV